MSKSYENKMSRIEITDPPDLIVTKIKKAVTDSTSHVSYDPVNRLGVSNLIDIHSILIEKPANEICDDYKNLDTGKYVLFQLHD